MSSPFLSAALEYAARGWHVFPVTPGDKPPLGSLVPTGNLEASVDPAQIRAWWTARPDANVGISLEPSGLVVLDVDVGPGKGGDQAVKEFSGVLPRTLMARTGSGGCHVVFTRPEGCPAVRRIRFRPGLDLLAKGYIVAAPSVLSKTGGQYKWSDTSVAIAPLPDVLRAELGSAAEQVDPMHPRAEFPPASPELLEHVREVLRDMGPSVSGQGGDQHAYRVAATLVHDYALGLDEAQQLIVWWNVQFPENRWSLSKLDAKLRNGSRYAKGGYGDARQAFEFFAAKRPAKSPREPEDEESGATLVYVVDAARIQRVPVRTYSTGFPPLDLLLNGGLHTRQLCTVCGPPAAGKSSWAVTVATRIARGGLPALYASTELESDELAARFAAPILGCAWTDIARGRRSTDEVAAALADLSVAVLGCEMLPRDGDKAIDMIGEHAAALADQTGTPPLIVVDYLQDLARGAKEAKAAAAEVATALRVMAQTLDCPVLPVSSVSRAWYGAAKAETMRNSDDASIYLTAAKESGDVDYASAVILFLDVDTEGGGDSKLARIAVARSRFGRTGFAGARFHGASGVWESCPEAVVRMSGDGRANRKDEVARAALDEKAIARVRKFLEANEYPSKEMLREACGVSSKATWQEAMDRLVDAGKLTLIARHPTLGLEFPRGARVALGPGYTGKKESP